MEILQMHLRNLIRNQKKNLLSIRLLARLQEKVMKLVLGMSSMFALKCCLDQLISFTVELFF